MIKGSKQISEVNNKEKLNQIFEKYRINPKEYSRYVSALTHSSYSHEHHLNYDYERYEFLGDSAISWIITNFLFNKHDLSEGQMSIIKAKLVCTKTFAQASKELGLDCIVKLGNGMMDKPISEKVLENLFEAFIGAVARDVGIKKAAMIVEEVIIKPYLEGKIIADKPYKTLIQECLMRSEKNDIKYIALNSKNELPRKVELRFEGDIYGYGEGNNIKEAEENAAKDAYHKLANKKVF